MPFMHRRSSAVSPISSAFRFSSRKGRLFVPKIGTMSSPCAKSHAKANCPPVHPFSAAISWMQSTNRKFFLKFSP